LVTRRSEGLLREWWSEDPIHHECTIRELDDGEATALETGIAEAVKRVDGIVEALSRVHGMVRIPEQWLAAGYALWRDQ